MSITANMLEEIMETRNPPQSGSGSPSMPADTYGQTVPTGAGDGSSETGHSTTPNVLKDHISTIVAGSALGMVIVGIVVLGVLGHEDATLHDVAIGLTGVLGGVAYNRAVR
jgi:hypothetical protein